MILRRDECLASLHKEVRILVHLSNQVEAAMLDYRPTPKQRSTMELLRYLVMMGPVLLRSIEAGKFLLDDWNAEEARVKTLDFVQVKRELAALSDFYSDAWSALTDESLCEAIQLFGEDLSRARAILDWIICGHAAYRTQLFCYLKACGREELGTSDLWAGVAA